MCVHQRDSFERAIAADASNWHTRPMPDLGDEEDNDRRSARNAWRGGDMVTQPAMRSDRSTDPTMRRPYLTVVRGAVPGQLFKIPGGKATIGRGNECGIQLAGSSLSREHVEIRRVGSTVTISDLKSTNGSWVNSEPLAQRVLRDGDKIQLGPSLVLRFNLKDVVDEAFQRSQFEAMTRDSLTGCYNRMFFDSELAREVLMARSTGLPVSIAMLDLDYFKAVNDTFGHGAGDQVLQDVAGILRGALRSYDVVARYGGEEFGIIMRGAERAIARRCMERVRTDVEKHVCVVGTNNITLTMSIGVACSDECPGTDESMLMAAADMRMYVAKRDGRNRVIGAEVSFDTVVDTEEFTAASEPMQRREMVATLPRGRVRLKPLSELTERERASRVTLPGKRRT